MAKNKDQDPAAADQEAADDPTSPAIEAIDPRQVEATGLTSTPDEEDLRTAERPDPKDDPALPNDVSNVVSPEDPMTLTGKDAEPGESGA